MINKIDFSAKNLTSNAGLFLLFENAKTSGIFELIDTDLVFDKVVTKMLQYRKFPKISSPIGRN